MLLDCLILNHIKTIVVFRNAMLSEVYFKFFVERKEEEEENEKDS